MTPELKGKVVIVSVTLGVAVLSWASLFVIPSPTSPPPPSSPVVDSNAAYGECLALRKAAGVTAKLWSMTDMVRVIEDWEASRSAKVTGETVVG